MAELLQLYLRGLLRSLSEVAELLQLGRVVPLGIIVVCVSQVSFYWKGNDYVTNLPLQMAIYFNAFFAPFWIIVTVVGLEVKYDELNILYKITLIAVYITYTIIEVVRLYVGYTGNLMERVPELAGFWLLTLLIQFPLILLLTFNEDARILPIERAVNIVEGLFVLFEIICGYIAIRIMVNYQVTKFHLRQFADLEDMADNEYWLEQAHEAHEHYS